MNKKRLCFLFLKNLEETISDKDCAIVDVQQKGHSYKIEEKAGYTENEVEVSTSLETVSEKVTEEEDVSKTLGNVSKKVETDKSADKSKETIP